VPDNKDLLTAEMPKSGLPLSTATQEPRLLIESALFPAIIGDAQDAIIARSLDGRVTNWNSSATRLFGYSAADMIGGSITRLFPPDRLQEEGELIARLLSGKTVSHFVTRRIRKDGAHIDVSVTLSPVRDASGTIVGVSKVVRDITETQQQHLALALSAAIVEHSDDAIIAKSLDGTVMTWNSGATRIFGYTAAEMIGGSIARLFPAARLHEESELSAQLARGKKISNFVSQRLRKSGALIDVSVTLSPVRDASGKIVAISKVARDITEAYQGQLASAVAAAIVEHSDDAIILKTLDGTVINWSLGAQQMFGYTATEMIGGPITRLFPDDRSTEEPELISQLVLGKTVDHFITRRIRKDGASLDVSVTLSPVRDAHGKIIAVSKIVRDVTTARQQHIHALTPSAATLSTPQPAIRSTRALGAGTEDRALADRALSEKIDELLRNEQRFQTLMRLTSQVIWTNNPEGRMLGAQPGWAAFTGQSFDEYQGFGWSAAVHPDDAQPTIDEWNRCVEGRRPFLFEHRLRRHDGVYRNCTINAAPVLNDDRSIREWVGVHSDITERRQQVDEIRAQEARLRFLTEAMPQMVWAAQPDGSLNYFNHRWFSYTGTTKEQAQGWGWSAALHPDDLQKCIRAWSHSVATGEPLETECRFLRASDETYRWHLNRAVSMRNAHGAIISWFGTATDIQDYKEAEAKNLSLQAELEDRVRQRTAELAGVGKIAGVGGWSFNLANGAVHWSDETCRILDLQSGHQPTLDEAIGMYVPGSRAVLQAAYQRCIADAEPYDLELQLTTATGRAIWVRAVGDAQLEQRVVVRIFGALQDITVRKLAERQLSDQHELLRRANERFGLAAGAAGIGVWEWDLSSNVLRWDDQMYRLYGRVPTEGVEPYSLWATSLHAEDRGRAEREINDALRNNTGFETEFRIVLPTGEIRYVMAAAQLQYDATGVAISMTGVNFDITARKRSELNLKHTSALLRLVMDSASDLSIIATTPDFTISVFNKGAERMLGYDSAEFIGRATPMAFHDSAEVEARGLELTASMGRSIQGAGVFTEPATLDVPQEWTYIRKDQSRVPVLLNVSAMLDDSGTLSGYLGIARDVTRDREHDRSLREAKSEAERANAAKSEFLANMSHEIRTPLNAVIGLGYLLEQTSLTDEQRSFLRKINFAGRSLLSVANNVLDLSKIEAREMRLEDAEVDLKHLVQDIGEMLTPSAHAKGLALTVHCAAALPSQLRGDTTRMSQIVTNLLSNAIKFTEKGQVELVLSCSTPTTAGITVRLSVRDTGIGIAPEGLARLFKPFSQADTSTTRRFGGTGLGLSIARRFAELMGGEIGVTSTVGVGSEFWVEIPLRVAVAAHSLIDRALLTTDGNLGPRWLSGAKILVVDDSEINCEVAQHILRGQGATVVISGTGAEALERLRQDPNGFEIVLMDVQMPDMDGNETTRRIRTELHLTLPIIALTAGALPSERERSLQAGMNDFMTKPFDPAEMARCIHRHLRITGEGMTAAELTTPALVDEWPEIEGIDGRAARARLRGDVRLFQSMLRRLFAEGLSVCELAEPGAVDALAIEPLAARLHKLRGAAATLGATDVTLFATAAEEHCRARDGARAAHATRQLLEALRVLQQAANLRDVDDAATMAGEPGSPLEIDAGSLADLIRLLRDSDLAAIDRFTALSPQLLQRMGKGPFNLAREHLDNLRFAEVATELIATPL